MAGGTTAWRRRRVRGDGLDLAVFELSEPADNRPTIVLVHGYPDTHGVWDGVAPLLAERFHVVTYDVRGAGASGIPNGTEGYDLDHLVADLAAVVDATSPDRPIHLVGHDWGSVQSWEAVTTAPLAGRLLSFTSISGPCLDHVRPWMTRRRSLRPTLVRPLLRQLSHSLYVLAFQTPVLPELFWTVGSRPFARQLRRSEGIPAGAGHPAATLRSDAKHGLGLYRRNVPERMARPRERRTDLPVQVVVPLGDSYVTPAATADVALHAPNTTRREVAGSHWIPVAHPERVARWITELVDEVEGTATAPALVRARAGAGRLDGSSAVVIGAGGDVGRAVAAALRTAGATVTAFAGDPGAVDVAPDLVVTVAEDGGAGWDGPVAAGIRQAVAAHEAFADAVMARGDGGRFIAVAAPAICQAGAGNALRAALVLHARDRRRVGLDATAVCAAGPRRPSPAVIAAAVVGAATGPSRPVTVVRRRRFRRG